MIESRTAVICSYSRCSSCDFQSVAGCQKLELSFHRGLDYVLLIEPERRLIHMSQQRSVVVNPPWESSQWQTVYIPEYSRLLRDTDKVFEAYGVGPYFSIFFLDEVGNGLSYEALPLLKSELEHELLDDLTSKVAEIECDKTSFRIGIADRIRQTRRTAFNFVRELFPEMNEQSKLTIASVISHRMVALNRFFPIILDNQVEEIYLDTPSDIVYFDHNRLGRCRSDFLVKEEIVRRIVTMLRAESNSHLDYRNPSLKTSFSLNGIQLRFSAGIPPLCPSGFYLQIRRAATNPYSILDLVMNNTMTSEIAALLLLAIRCRMNITIVGEPGAGKTTLLNALDMTTPPIWRKVYIEDAAESRQYDNQHQLHIGVDSIDEISGLHSKTNEIVKSLHRSPDYLILGEIQTSEHSQALFQALAAGLRTIQTCHSGSASNLLTRWISVHSVPPSNVALMDVIVTVIRPKVGNSKRRVQEIAEIRRDFVNGVFEFKGLNRIFDHSRSKTETRACISDGAFQRRMQEIGIENHKHLLENMADIVQNHLSVSKMDMDLFLKRIWSG